MKKLIIANWKMQLSIKESLALARQLKKADAIRAEAVICPDYSAIPSVAPILKGSRLMLGAQDAAASSRGALTGEVSPVNLKTLGVRYIILGHSERREHLHENSAIVNDKVKAALENGLIPIVCVGEKRTEREAGKTEEYLRAELHRALKGVKIRTAKDLVVAYEPVWAISTNKNAKPMAPHEAEAIHKFLKAEAKKILRQAIRVIYGGSASPANAAAYLNEPDVDGLLVGGASLKAKTFLPLLR